MSTEWILLKEFTGGETCEVSNYVEKFRVMRTYQMGRIHYKYIKCTAHQECPFRLRVNDNEAEEITSIYSNDMEHSKEGGHGLTDAMKSLIIPLISAGQAPKVIRNILRRVHGYNRRKFAEGEANF